MNPSNGHDTASQIVARLEPLFAEQGFAEPGVSALRAASGVSLRTLYKYYPSREDMVVAALQYRRDRYLDELDREVPTPGTQAAVLHVYRRLGEWLAHSCHRGCLLLHAVAAYPNNDAVRALAALHKAEVRAVLRERLAERGSDELADALMLIHEGQTSQSMVADVHTVTAAALSCAQSLLTQAGVPA